MELLSRVYRSDLCAAALERAGFPALPTDRKPFALADGLRFDQDDPLAYLKSLPFAGQPVVASLLLPDSASADRSLPSP